MVKKALSLAVLLFIATAGVAQAQAYPPPENSITVNVDVHIGGDITISSQTYKAGTPVVLELLGQGGFTEVVLAGADGIATITRPVPDDAKLGNHTVKSSGIAPDGSNLVLTTQTDVGAAPASVLGQSISRTGIAGDSSDGTPIAQVLLLAAVGGGLLALGLVRRHSTRTNATESAGV